MTTEELYQQFLSRYDGIIRGGIEGDMERLGEMTKRVIRWMSVNEPALAAQAIAILDGEDKKKEFCNYLTEQEARAIVEGMVPSPKWELEKLEEMLRNAGLPTDEPPYFNRWALLTDMCKIQSDNFSTLKSIIGSPGHPATSEEMLAAIYQLALNDLRDKDGKFNIRKYFDL
jgi:hypothetical protein